MRIAFVQTYPIYHDFWSTPQWLAVENRDKWMPALVASLGHEVELWAVDRLPGVHHVPVRPGGNLVVRLFSPSRAGRRSKFHESEALVTHCRAFAPDLCVLKGVDGGAGVRLIDLHLRPNHLPFAFVIGGKFYTRHVPKATAVFYETEGQRAALLSPRRPWRRHVSEHRLIHLPKTVDTDRFRPLRDGTKSWDVLTIGRLVKGVKSYDALGDLPANRSIAVVGAGPALDSLRKQYPHISWLGQIPYQDIPDVMGRARLLFHTSLREYSPRVLAEAAACGLPAVAFEDVIGQDVLTPECGMRVSRKNFVEQIDHLLSDPRRLSELSASSRAFAEHRFSISALYQPVQRLFDLLQQGP